MKNQIPLWYKVVYVFLIVTAFYFFLPTKIKSKIVYKGNVAEVDKIVYNAIPREKIIDTFIGELTGYGPDCKGCSGITKSKYDVRNGNIYYYDNLYGKVRIVAADKNIPFGTIVRISALNISKEPIVDIVLDTVSAINGTIFDLLYKNEAQTRAVGRQKNVKYEVLRKGW